MNMSTLPHYEQRQCLLAHFSSGTLGLFGFKGPRFDFFRWGGGVLSPWSSSQPTSLLLWLFSSSPLRLAALPACDRPLTSRWPVTCRHPPWLPLMCCLLLCTVGVNHTPWESGVEFHTMGPLACVVWGLREGLEIKGQPVCEVNSRGQYVTYSTFSQRMLLSVDFLSTWCFWLKGWWLPGLCLFFPCFHFSAGISCSWI